MDEQEKIELTAALDELVPQTRVQVVLALGEEKLEFYDLVERLRESPAGVPNEWVLRRTLFTMAELREIDCELVEGESPKLYLWNATSS